MNAAALIQLAASALAVAAMTGVAAWATRGRGAPPLDERAARALLAEEFPGRPLDDLWLADDHLGALARSGDRALVLARLGDGYVARQIAWTSAAATSAKDGKVRLKLRDAAAPSAVLAFAAWPPSQTAREVAA